MIFFDFEVFQCDCNSLEVNSETLKIESLQKCWCLDSAEFLIKKKKKTSAY